MNKLLQSLARTLMQGSFTWLMLSLKDAERFTGCIRSQGGAVPKIPYSVRRDALFCLAKRGSDVSGNKGQVLYSVEENRPKGKYLDTSTQKGRRTGNLRMSFYRPKQYHNLIKGSGMGRCKAAQGLLAVLVLFVHPLFNTTIRKPNGLFISDY